VYNFLNNLYSSKIPVACAYEQCFEGGNIVFPHDEQAMTD